MTWKDTLKEGQELVLATSSKDGKPHTIVVVSQGFVDKKLLLNVVFMKTTLENIKTNNKVSIITKFDSKYYRIEGNATFYTSGKYFDTAIDREKEFTIKGVLVIDIQEVYSLDPQKKIL
jgi:predicted pyridoxine 5'-phosphate oxidase superfamily flavin-nucleotide-binding protein